MKVEPAHPLLVSAVVGTCAPLVHRLTNNKFVTCGILSASLPLLALVRLWRIA
jgi:hypothetical protein